MNRRNKQSRRRGDRASVPGFSFEPSYQGQQRVRVKLEVTPTVLSTTVTTGVIAASFLPDPTTVVGDWATRFEKTFDEYRLLGIDVKLESLVASTGVTRCWWEEKNQVPPDLKESQQQTIVSTLRNTNAARQRVAFQWRAKDLEDLQFIDTAVSFTPVCFQIYTDATNYGSPIVATPLWLLSAVLHVEFKGINAA